MTDPFSAAIIAAVNFVVSTATSAQFASFVGSTLLSVALAPDGPKLSDLRIQTSAYGAPIPRLYGTTVRVAGNIIDKSDLIPVEHLHGIKKGLFAPLGDIGFKTYTYYAHFAVLLSEGNNGNMIAPSGLKRIWANGVVIFDRDRAGSTPGTANFRGVQDAFGWTRNNFVSAHIGTVAFYPGTATQGVDPTMSALYPGEEYPAYRHSCYVVLERFDLADWGNRPPNLEFELEPTITRLGDIVSDIASFAGVNVYTNRLTEEVRGFIVANDGPVWNAIEPLAATFSFDLIQTQARFEAVKRGRYMRTVVAAEDMGAVGVKDSPRDRKEVSAADPNKLPDEVTITYLDVDRDYQPNTQRAARNEGYSTNKINAEVAIVLSADEAADAANRSLQEALARGKTLTFSLSEKYRWLKASNVIGVPIGGVVEPVRLLTMTRSPNGVIECEAVYEDPYIYVGGLSGSSGNFTPGEVALSGDTIIQPMDTAILNDADDNTGFYAAFAGSEVGWHGATFSRALGVGSPLTFEVLGDVGPVPAQIGECTTTLASGPTDVWDRVNTLTVEMYGTVYPESMDEADVLLTGGNLAWVGDPDGEDGEFIHFATVTVGSPANVLVLSNLLRGRHGTEFAVGSHGSGERIVVINDNVVRPDFGPADWNLARTYQGESLPTFGDGVGERIEFTNTGEGKRPLSGVLPVGVRDTSNNLTLTWVRRSRFQTGDVAAPVPLGEETESYEVDVLSGVTVVRTIAATTPSVSYSAAQQTADGLTPGNPVSVKIYQLSTIRGRGRVLSATV